MILLICCLCLINQVPAQSYVIYNGDTINRHDSLNNPHWYWRRTGKETKTTSYQPDKLFDEGYYVHGSKEGEWKTYHENGNVRARITFVHDKKTGPYTSYYWNGQVEETATLKEGEYCCGLRLKYYSTGILERQWSLDSLGRQQGEQFTWYDTGKKEMEYNAKDGKTDGWMKIYYPNGLIKAEYFYNENVIDQAKTKLYPENERTVIRDPWLLPPAEPPPSCGPHVIGVCVQGRLYNGKQYQYNDKGVLVKVKIYKNGIYNGDADIGMEPDSVKHSDVLLRFTAHTAVQQQFCDSVFKTLQCPKSIEDTAGSVTATDSTTYRTGFSGEGTWIRYQNFQVWQKGTYHNRELICGLIYFHDKEGRLTHIQARRDGKSAEIIAVPNQ